jgi:catechol 2,3-dioxygenase-like lactoylglutathione lyase family enzyme|tara:strand:+ start:62 stop:577 length:516 start_codon:yes stop_codon:yes gene_type:complete
MAKITIDHVALMVSDLEKSLEFYRDIVGMEIVSPEEHEGGPINEMTQMGDVHMREYRLRAPGGVNGYTRDQDSGGQLTFDLIEWIRPTSPQQRQPIHHVPSAHICFGVEDVPATYERLKAAGVEIVSPPVSFTGEGNWHVLFFYDPDGNLLELNEVGTGQQEDHDFNWSTA